MAAFNFQKKSSNHPTSGGNRFGFSTMLSLPKSLIIGMDENDKPIRLSTQNHNDLLEHIKQRLLYANPIREQQADKFKRIDLDVFGFLLLDQEDQQRHRENIQGKGLKPTDHKLSLVWSQLDEAATYLGNVLAPDAAIYNARAPAAKQDTAKAFTALMNKQGDYFGHYVQYLRFIFDCLRLNFGGYDVNWQEIFGNKITSGQVGAMKIDWSMLFSGNKIETIDPYNFIYDISCHPCNLNIEGEFYAMVDMASRFKLRRMEETGKIYNFAQYMENNRRTYRFWRAKPVIRGSNEASTATDWVSVFSMGEGTDVMEDGYERVRYTGWVRPHDWGLPTNQARNENKHEIWRFTILNDSMIAHAERLNNAHGMLPVNIAMPNDDGYVWQTKSFAEHLIPYQNFGSFQLNTAQRAARKALVGLTIYDENVFPYLRSNDSDLAGGKIPGNSQGDPDLDFRKKFAQFNDVPDTRQNVQDVSTMSQLMQKIMPTDQLQQVAGLDRATQYQAAATVQGGNRRNLKVGKIIYIQAMARGHHQQFYNIMQYQQSMELLTPEGELISINPTEFRDANMEFEIDDGLKGIDKIAFRIEMKELTNSIIQSQQALTQIDLVAWLDYYTTLIGDFTDLKQFKIQSPIDALPADQRNLAFQLLQQFMAEQQGNQQGGQQGGQPLTAVG